LVILSNLFEYFKNKVEMIFDTSVLDVNKYNDTFTVITEKGDYVCDNLVLATGRSGSKWIARVCEKFGINTQSNRVDIGCGLNYRQEYSFI
jgi:uncharacterized FAD-dependent dehydrogenase